MNRSEPLLHRVVHARDLVNQLVVRDLKLKYKRSVLGIGWSLLNPLLQLLVFYFVFRYIVPVPVDNFAVFLFSGILAWNWFQQSLFSGCGAITDNVALIRQPGFPPAILPLSTVAAALVNFLLSVPILFLAVAFTTGLQPLALIAFPFILVVQFVLTLSIVYLLATIHVPLRDTQYLIGIVLLLGFYLSPVFYSSDSVPAHIQKVYRLNPLVHLLEGYRSVFVYGRFPEFLPLLYIALASSVLLVFTYSLFNKMSHRFVEEIGS